MHCMVCDSVPNVTLDLNTAAVAQLVVAPDCGSGCRGFESHQPPQSRLCFPTLTRIFCVRSRKIGNSRSRHTGRGIVGFSVERGHNRVFFPAFSTLPGISETPV